MISLRKDIVERKKIEYHINPIIIFILSLSIGLFPMSALYFDNIIDYNKLKPNTKIAVRGLLLITSIFSLIFVITSFTYHQIMSVEHAMMLTTLVTIVNYGVLYKINNEKVVKNTVITTKGIEDLI